MANHTSDIEAAPPAGNLGDIDFRCGTSHPASVAPSQGGAGSHATLVRGTAQNPAAQAARRSYPLLSRTGISVAESADTETAMMSNAASLQALLRLRHVRAALFPEKIFVQPAWDMLLELLECRLHRRRISVSGLYLEAGVPPATALRRLQDMEDAGLITRVSDPSDRRRQFVELTPQALHQFQAFARHSDVLQTLRMEDCGGNP